MNTLYQQMEKTARDLIANDKGILAADESRHTITSRFNALGIESTEQTRRAFREILFTAPGIEQYISGVILFDETIRQSDSDGTPFIKLLKNRGIIPGIKVDNGTKPLSFYPGEKITEGLDMLRERLKEYAGMGARFAKWRAVIEIGSDIPSIECIEANAHALARFAALSQESGLVPIVEPEVLMDGSHDLSRCEEATQMTLRSVFGQLYKYRVTTECMLLKPNMVVPGLQSSSSVTTAQIAEATIMCMKRMVPSSVPGIVFLSGGQKPEEAAENLNAMNAGKRILPWKMSFSFSRALQKPVIDAWKGNEQNTRKAQAIFLHRARCAGAASRGVYSDLMEKEAERP